MTRFLVIFPASEDVEIMTTDDLGAELRDGTTPGAMKIFTHPELEPVDLADVMARDDQFEYHRTTVSAFGQSGAYEVTRIDWDRRI